MTAGRSSHYLTCGAGTGIFTRLLFMINKAAKKAELLFKAYFFEPGQFKGTDFIPKGMRVKELDH